MVEYKFVLKYNDKKEAFLLDAPNPTVANLIIVGFLLDKGILKRSNESKRKYELRRINDIGVVELGEVREYPTQPFVKKTTPSLKSNINKQIKEQLKAKYGNRRRGMSEVLTDKDSGKAYQY